ncbi:Zinc finger C-x8-C-x5-C-x3-H type (and similar) family protein [Brugia pahangi]
MAAVVHSKKEEQDLWAQQAQQFGMVPMAMEFWDFLYQTYGIERHMTYFNQEEPNRMYFITHGKLNYIDLSGINPKFSKMFEKRSLAPSKDSKRPIRPCKSVWQALTDVERKEFQKERSKKRSYKTSLCKTYRETKKCVYGDACIFAHGEGELRLPPQIHPKYKTQLCRNFSKWNYCPYGAKCLFIHERSYENVDFTNMRTDDSASINNFPYTNSFDVEQMNTNNKCINPQVSFGKSAQFAEKDGFCHSATSASFNRAENMGHSTVKNQFPDNIAYRDDRSMDYAATIAINNILDNNGIIEQLSEQLSNV